MTTERTKKAKKISQPQNTIRWGLYLMMMTAIGNRKKRKLVEYFGGSKALYEADYDQLLKSGILEENACHTFMEERIKYQTKEVEDFLQEKNYYYVTIEEDNYPKRLKQIPDAPYGIFYRGELPSDDNYSVAVVGARMCSNYGKKIAEELCTALASNGVQIISGMALGIDVTAAKAAMDAGSKTYAVMGNGIDECYPRKNLPVYLEVEQTGGIISELPPGQKPLAFHFPLRNRIISGLADLVIVIEAKEKSGSLITADFALEQGKDIYAVPGRIGDSLSNGCNRLIKQGAGIILNSTDLLEELRIAYQLSDKKYKKMKVPLEKEEMLVYSSVDLFPKTSQQIMEESKIEYTKLIQVLVDLQIKGYIKEVTKDFYVRQ